MATFCRAALAAAVAACALLAGAGSALAYNPHNNGNHYGWYSSNGRHLGLIKQGLLPAPAPVPLPVPRPNPNGHPSSGGSTTSHTGSGLVVDWGPLVPELPAVVMPEVPEVSAPPVALVNAGRGNPLEWMVLMILPALAAVWLLVFARAALSAARRRRKAEAA